MGKYLEINSIVFWETGARKMDLYFTFWARQNKCSKFETMRIHFYNDVFAPVAIHATKVS